MKDGTVVHLHGSLHRPDTMVVTTREYLDYYRNTPATGSEENHAVNFLRDLFNQRVVLFIGYGMGDQEMLEYILLKSEYKPARPKHYILQPFFSNEQEIARLYAQYYEDCGIKMLPFSRDENDHEQLIAVLEKFAAVMPGKALMETERLLEMRAMLP